MKKLSLSVIGMYLMMAQAFSQDPDTDSSGYRSKKFKLDEVNLVTSYYDQTANKSAVMGGDPGHKGIADVTDFANGLDLKFIGWDKKQRKNTLAVGLGIDYHTAASQAYIDSNGTSKNNGTRIYPTLSWSRENDKKGTSFGLGIYYSAENNYYHSFGFNASVSKKNKTNGEFSLKMVGFFDQIKMIYPAEFYPVDSLKNAPVARQYHIYYFCQWSNGSLVYNNGQLVGNTKSHKQGTLTKPRNTLTASLSFTQIISQRMQGSMKWIWFTRAVIWDYLFTGFFIIQGKIPLKICLHNELNCRLVSG